MDDLLKLIKMYDARGRQINRLQRVLARKNRRIHRQHMQLKAMRDAEGSMLTTFAQAGIITINDPNEPGAPDGDDPSLGYIDRVAGWSKPQTVSEAQPHAD